MRYNPIENALLALGCLVCAACLRVAEWAVREDLTRE